MHSSKLQAKLTFGLSDSLQSWKQDCVILEQNFAVKSDSRTNVSGHRQECRGNKPNENPLQNHIIPKSGNFPSHEKSARLVTEPASQLSTPTLSLSDDSAPDSNLPTQRNPITPTAGCIRLHQTPTPTTAPQPSRTPSYPPSLPSSTPCPSSQTDPLPDPHPDAPPPSRETQPQPTDPFQLFCLGL